MYLIEIDEETGLISEEKHNSGWKAIKIFNDFYKKHGIKGMTVIALSQDYASPFTHYDNNDRPIRATEEVYGSRTALKTQSKLFKEALDKYKELQFNPDLEQERINKEIKIRLINRISDANDKEDDSEIEKLRKSLSNHENTIEQFNKRFNKKEALGMAVTNNNYELSRIENDILSRKNSKFVNHGEDVENPNKLGLNN